MAIIKKTVSYLAVGALVVSLLSGCIGGEKSASSDIVEINFLSVWQGDSVREPDDVENNIVLKKIKEKTGVAINLQYNNVSEIERLNTMFASGDFPDLVSAPMWGMDDAATNILKKAAREEMIMPIDELVEKYGPNIKPAFSEGLASDFIKYDLESEEFGGKRYFIPATVTPLEQRVDINTSGLFIREDILKALNYDVSKLSTSEDLYELLRLIDAGGFKDANGGKVIPGGLLHNANGLGEYYKSYTDAEGGFTGLFITEDGKVCDDLYNPLLDKQTLYLRKLFSQNLLDIEGLSQNSARAQEKISTGKYAVVPGKYTDIYGYCRDTLYKTNPEMKYVALPPLKNANGNRNIYKLKGTGGCSVLFIPHNSKKAEATIKLLNFLFTEEGYLLANYGIEGESYKLNEEGKAEFIGQYADMDISERYKHGIGSYLRMTGLQYTKKYSVTESMSPDQQKAYDTLKTDFVYKDGIRISYLELANPKVEEIRNIKSNSKITEVKNKAYCAASDEEALRYLEEFRKQVKQAGIEELWRSVEEYIMQNPDENYLY